MIVNYDESILTYIASIRKYYGLDSSFDSNEYFDNYLNDNKPKRIFLLLIDGMGYNLVVNKLKDDSFLKKNILYKTTTVFPTTTTSATTSIQNGKAPNENAWLGWCQYFKEKDDVIIPFLNIGYYNEHKYEKDFSYKAISVDTTVNELNRLNKKARILFPSFMEDGCKYFDEMCERLKKYSQAKEYDYIYAYWDGYDSLMHEFGPSSNQSNAYIEEIDNRLKKLSEELDEETLLVVTADHGQIDVEEYIDLYPSFEKYFVHDPSLDIRTQAYFVKDELKDEFEKVFKNKYEDDFILLTHDQVLASNLFGPKDNHPRFEEFIGDFVSISKSKKSFVYSKYGKPNMFKGQHSGMLEDELYIPIIAYKK